LPPDEVPEGTKWIGKIDLRMLAPSRRPISDKVFFIKINSYYF